MLCAVSWVAVAVGKSGDDKSDDSRVQVTCFSKLPASPLRMLLVLQLTAASVMSFSLLAAGYMLYGLDANLSFFHPFTEPT